RKLHKARQRVSSSFASALRDETVALSGHVLDVPSVAFTIAERLAQRAHVDAKIPRGDHEIAPNARDEVPVTHDLTGVLDQRNQDVQRAIPQRERNAISLDHALRGRQAERSE